ncbi:MAG: hypothetical protein P9F75_14070 [Candidatus Contendobacter sp.]|nr:hypothetical protein [Candidatus Contendobacter sp.]
MPTNSTVQHIIYIHNNIANTIFRNYKLVLLLIFCFVAANTFAFIFVYQERYVYIWDWAVYWIYYQDFGALLLQAPQEAFRSLAASVTQDYSYLPVLPLAPFSWVFGGSRLAYILAITNIFVLPAVLLIGWVVQCLDKCSNKPAGLSEFALVTLFCLTLHPLWAPVLQGRPDIVGLVVVLIILSIYFKNPLCEKTYGSLLFIGLLLSLIFLLRRWYAYWAIAFFPAAMLADLFRPQKAGSNFLVNVLLTLRNTALIGITSGVVLWIIAQPLIIRALTTDYADAFSAYKMSATFLDGLGRTVDYFGAPLLTACGLGLIILTLRKETRFVGAFFLMHSAIIFGLFFRVQDFHPHHFYLFFGMLAITIGIFLTWIYTRLKFFLVRSLAVASIFLFSISASLVFFFPAAHAIVKPWMFTVLPGRLPENKHFPLVRYDMDRLRILLTDLEGIYAKEPGEIYVVASSLIINDDVLRNLCREVQPPILPCSSILVSNHVDKRDGFPRQILAAKYVVLAAPAQYHMRPEDQRVIGFLARDFEAGRGISGAFHRLSNSYQLEHDVSISIFHRIHPIPEQALQELAEEFRRSYPDHSKLFTITPAL